MPIPPEPLWQGWNFKFRDAPHSVYAVRPVDGTRDAVDVEAPVRPLAGLWLREWLASRSSVEIELKRTYNNKAYLLILSWSSTPVEVCPMLEASAKDNLLQRVRLFGVSISYKAL